MSLWWLVALPVVLIGAAIFVEAFLKRGRTRSIHALKPKLKSEQAYREKEIGRDEVDIDELNAALDRNGNSMGFRYTKTPKL
ncbi:MAG: hypothetical protein AAF429_15450 [Pseudomonadota bacterium]